MSDPGTHVHGVSQRKAELHQSPLTRRGITARESRAVAGDSLPYLRGVFVTHRSSLCGWHLRAWNRMHMTCLASAHLHVHVPAEWNVIRPCCIPGLPCSRQSSLHLGAPRLSSNASCRPPPAPGRQLLLEPHRANPGLLRVTGFCRSLPWTPVPRYPGGGEGPLMCLPSWSSSPRGDTKLGEQAARGAPGRTRGHPGTRRHPLPWAEHPRGDAAPSPLPRALRV